jgi:hypothetical protein
VSYPPHEVPVCPTLPFIPTWHSHSYHATNGTLEPDDGVGAAWCQGRPRRPGAGTCWREVSSAQILMAKSFSLGMNWPTTDFASASHPYIVVGSDFAISIKSAQEPNGMKLSANALLYQCFACLSTWSGSPQANLGQRVTAWDSISSIALPEGYPGDEPL